MDIRGHRQPIVEIKKKPKISLGQLKSSLQKENSSTGKLSLNLSTEKIKEIQKKLKPKKIQKAILPKKDRLFFTLKWLEKEYPNLFDIKKRSKPLKLGIAKEIKMGRTQEECADINLALKFYCSGPAYLKGIVEGNLRFDLEGNECGLVSAKHAQSAQKSLEKIINCISTTVNASKLPISDKKAML